MLYYNIHPDGPLRVFKIDLLAMSVTERLAFAAVLLAVLWLGAAFALT